MKMLFSTLLVSLLAPAFAQACGHKVEGFQGDKVLAEQMRAKNVICEISGTTISGELQTRALYRCMGSPWTLNLVTSNENIIVDEIKALADGSYSLSSLGASISCKLRN